MRLAPDQGANSPQELAPFTLHKNRLLAILHHARRKDKLSTIVRKVMSNSRLRPNMLSTLANPAISAQSKSKLSPGAKKLSRMRFKSARHGGTLRQYNVLLSARYCRTPYSHVRQSIPFRTTKTSKLRLRPYYRDNGPANAFGTSWSLNFLTPKTHVKLAGRSLVVTFFFYASSRASVPLIN